MGDHAGLAMRTMCDAKPCCVADSDIVSGQPLDRAEELAQVHPHLKRVLTRSTKAHAAAQRKRKIARARIIFIGVLELLLLGLSAVVWYVDKRDGKLLQLAGVPLVAWLLVAACVVPIAYASHVVVWLVCIALERALDNVFEQSEYALIGLRTGLWCAKLLNVWNTSRSCSHRLHFTHAAPLSRAQRQP